EPLSTLAQNSLPSAIDQFNAWATELGASDEQMWNMLGTMEGFKGALEAASEATGGLGTKQEILTLLSEQAEIGVLDQKGAIDLLRDSYGLNGSELDTLSAKMQDFADKNLSARSAARDYEEAIDDLTQSLIDNGTTLDITTEQ